MNILFIGDVVGEAGTNFLCNNLSRIKKDNNIDVTIANVENCGKGNGVSTRHAQMLYMAGIDIMTGGNHSFRRKDCYDFLDETEYIIRPANYPPTAPGKGFCYYEFNGKKILIINLIGRIYMEPLDSPFKIVENILKTNEADIIIVDIHAEATSEKIAMGYFLDGKVTCVFGTHTHVQTNDCRILPKKTAYITDVGMTGPENSVLGIDKDIILDKFILQTPVNFKEADGNCICGGVIVNIDKNNTASFVHNHIFR